MYLNQKNRFVNVNAKIADKEKEFIDFLSLLSKLIPKFWWRDTCCERLLDFVDPTLFLLQVDKQLMTG